MHFSSRVTKHSLRLLLYVWIGIIFLSGVLRFPFFFFLMHVFQLLRDKMYCSWNPQLFYSEKNIIGLTILFVYLKIILLQYF